MGLPLHIPVRVVDRESKSNRRSSSHLRPDGAFASVVLTYVLDDGQTQSRSPRTARSGLVDSVEALEDPVEIVSFRVGVKVPPSAVPALGEDLATAYDTGTEIEMLDRGTSLSCRVLPRAAVPDTPISGPLLIEDGTSTIYAPFSWVTVTDAHGNIVMNREEV